MDEALLEAWQREAEPFKRRVTLNDWISVRNEQLLMGDGSSNSVATELLTTILGLIASARAKMTGSGPGSFFTSPHRLVEITAVYSVAWHKLLQPARVDATIRKQIVTFFAGAFCLHPVVDLPPLRLQMCVLTSLFSDDTPVSERVESWKLLCRGNRGNGLTDDGPHWVASLLGSVEQRESVGTFLPAVTKALRDGRGVPFHGEVISWLILPMTQYDDSRSVVVEHCVEALLLELTLGYNPGRATAAWAVRWNPGVRTSAYGAALASLRSLLEPEHALETMQHAAIEILRRQDDEHPSSYMDLVKPNAPAPWLSLFMPHGQWQEQLAWAARFVQLDEGNGVDDFQPVRDDDAVSILYHHAFETAMRIGQSRQQLTLAQMATEAAAIAPFCARKSQVMHGALKRTVLVSEA
jgi:hypothetical protein